MSTLIIAGMKISYGDFNSDKKQTLLFVHGNSHAKNSFSHQTHSPLLQNYRLITIDLPGHGDSDKHSEYSLPLYGSVIAEVIAQLKLINVILVGHSLGGHAAVHSLKTTSPDGLFLYGTPLLKKPIDFNIFLDNPQAKALSQEDCKDEEIEDFLTQLRYENEDRKTAKNNFLRTDARVRTAILQSVVAGNYSDECTLFNDFAGKKIVLVSHEENLVNNKYIEQILKDLDLQNIATSIHGGHVPHVEAAEDFNQILANFAAETFSTINFINDNNQATHTTALPL